MLHLDLSAVPKIREIVSALGRALSVAWMTCGGLQFLDRILIGRQCHKLNVIDLKRYPDGINPMPEKAIAYFLFKPLVANNSAIRRELKLKTDYFPEGNQCAAMFDTIKQQFMAARVALVDFEFSWNTKLGEWDYDEFSVENQHIKRRLALSLDHPLKLTCEPINQN
ncbi:hypothetical protein DdX_11980 [Ditylenchus destructor]|uniref:Uncharacterized protein n=1 Tax=Ditylenchus destructor TaxID=166010 RepID=A0AAD4MZA3_9BILA|nr:hypothetical protein DdX_11980 [Ditylenchus destructor]